MAREGIAASQEYLRSLELHVGKKGLREFYDGATLAAKAIVAAAMVEKLQELGFTGEIARQFTILTLYDIVVLIGLTFLLFLIHLPQHRDSLLRERSNTTASAGKFH